MIVSSSVIIATYNWKEALAACLACLFRQTRLPDEIIVADDGSRDDTRALAEAMSRGAPCSVLHVWQPDEGFRLARIRNLAIARSRGEYLVFLDGDMVPDRHFLEDHYGGGGLGGGRRRHEAPAGFRAWRVGDDGDGQGAGGAAVAAGVRAGGRLPTAGGA